MKISKNSKGIGWEKENSNTNTDEENIDLTSYAKKADLPTKTSELTNDSGFITEHQDISGKANKSDIPTKTSQLTNDSGFITKVPSEYITEIELNSKGLATETFVTNKIADSLILTSPNGSKITITVSDDGQLSATPYGTNE